MGQPHVVIATSLAYPFPSPIVILNEVKDLPATSTREMLHFVQHDRDGQTGMLNEVKHDPLLPLDMPGTPGYSFP